MLFCVVHVYFLCMNGIRGAIMIAGLIKIACIFYSKL